MFIDDRTCCDQSAVHLLAQAGLIRHATPGSIGQRVPAQLTDAGRAKLRSRSSPRRAAGTTHDKAATRPTGTPLRDAA
jgi:hypothetical protein